MPAPIQARSGFTLLEILIVLAIIAGLSGLIVVNINALLNGIGTPPLEKVLQGAVREARYLAVTEKDTVSLGYDEERGEFIVSSENGAQLYVVPTQRGADAPVEVIFYHIEAVQGLSDDPLDGERTEVLQVFFHSDRSSTPFEAEISEGTGSGRRFRFDAFSDVLIETDD